MTRRPTSGWRASATCAAVPSVPRCRPGWRSSSAIGCKAHGDPLARRPDLPQPPDQPDADEVQHDGEEAEEPERTRRLRSRAEQVGNVPRPAEGERAAQDQARSKVMHTDSCRCGGIRKVKSPITVADRRRAEDERADPSGPENHALESAAIAMLPMPLRSWPTPEQQPRSCGRHRCAQPAMTASSPAASRRGDEHRTHRRRAWRPPVRS